MTQRRTLSIVCLIALAANTSASAYEAGYAGWAQKPGITLGGGTAGDPPPGLYMFDQMFTYQSNVVGPGNRLLNPAGTTTGVQAAVEANGFLWVPGWNILGAKYSAVLVQPFAMESAGSPVNFQAAGVSNTYVVPVELSWQLADSGIFVKTGLGIYVPDGTVTGVNGLGGIGSSWWTFQPEFIVSYLKNGWNFTANLFEEFNTKSAITNYRTGDVLHAEFTATKNIDKWTVGPLAYFVGQVTNDRSSAFYSGAINVNRYNIWAVGGLVGYNFGPVSLNVWALDEVSARASGGTPIAGRDTAAITKGASVFASISYRLWAPEDPSVMPRAPLYRK